MNSIYGLIIGIFISCIIYGLAIYLVIWIDDKIKERINSGIGREEDTSHGVVILKDN